ncbi:MAG: hypothetical protein ABWU16_08635 [Halothiobacillaceae bacterium]
MDKSKSRDDFSIIRRLHAAELDAHFLKLVEKSGLMLEQRGTAHPVRCIGWRMSDGWSAPMLAFAKNPQELTLISSLPLEEGQRLILERDDRLDKDRFVEGIIRHSRRGSRPNDDDHVFVSTMKITHGHF